MSNKFREANDSILDFIYPSQNDKLAKMDERDRLELVRRLVCYPLTLRSDLNLSSLHTFGLELEFDKANLEAIKRYMKKNPGFDRWHFDRDITVENGGEYVTPILYDCPETWKNLKKACKGINRNAKITGDCGGHIHMGAQILGDNVDNWLVFANMYATNENILFKFGYGDFLVPREEIEYWALPKAKNWINKLGKIDENSITAVELIKKLRHDRYDAVNLTNIDLDNISKLRKGSTIEFRSPNGTLNPVVWQNNVNTFAHLLEYSKNTEFDSNRFKKARKKAKYFASNLYYYDEMFLEQALRFADMIFDNNLDKIYFLRQYLGNYDVERDKSLILR